MSTGFQTPTTIGGWAKWIVVVLAIVACILVAANAFGIAIPSWVMTLLWIAGAAAFVCVIITFISKLAGGT